jgi:hypothetical protein
MRVLLVFTLFFLYTSTVFSQDFEAFLAKGDSSLEKRELNQAISFYKKALKVKPGRLLENAEEAKIFFQLSFAYSELSDHQTALEYLFKYIDKDCVKQNDSLLCDAYNSIGSNYDYLLQTEQALKFYQKSLNYAGSDPVKTGRAYNNTADSYQELKKYKEAKEYYLRALKYFEEGNADDGRLVAYINLGTIEVLDRRMELAQQYFENANAIAEEMQDPFYMVVAKVYLAEYYTSATDYEKAETILNWTLQNARKYNIPKYVNESYKRFVDLYEKKKDFENAFNYMKLYKANSDSLFNINSSMEYAELEAKYSIREKEKENDLLKTEQTLIESQVKSQKKYIRMLLGLVAIAVLFIGLFYYQRVKRSKAKKLLEIQNKEIKKSKKQLQDLNRQYEKLIAKYEGEDNQE